VVFGVAKQIRARYCEIGSYFHDLVRTYKLKTITSPSAAVTLDGSKVSWGGRREEGEPDR
jgi:hypothetical protein